MFKLLKMIDHKTTEWSGGKTSEIFIWPKDGSYSTREFDWRLSSATVEVPESDFTSLEGFDRYITVLEGELNLSHEDGVDHLINGNKVYGFNGGAKTHSFGKAIDFNLIYKSEMKCKMTRKVLEKGENVLLEIFYGGFLGVHIVSGEVEVSLEKDEKEMSIHAMKSADVIICYNYDIMNI